MHNFLNTEIFILFNDFKIKWDNYVQQFQNSLKETKWITIMDNMKKWGALGWTSPPDSEISEFYTQPPQKPCTDEYMKKYCTPKVFQELIEYLSEHYPANSSVLKEVQIDFNNQCFYSSALLLFSLIDRELGLFAKTEEHQKYPVGKKALREIHYKQKNYNDYDKCILRTSMVISCLDAMFQDATSINPPKVINRNLLSHGHWYAPVTNINCYQILFAYWNTMHMLNVIFNF